MSYKAPSNEPLISASLMALAVLTYGFWMTGGRFDFFPHAQEPLGLTFNSMLAHMLRGEFDVDPAIVGLEGFLRNGHTFAYWGPFFALLRLPLMLIPGGLSIDVTCFSCFIAVCIAAFVKMQALRLVLQKSAASALRDVLYWILLVAILFGGAQIEFLHATLYQEVCLWAGAMAAAFVYFALREILAGRFSARALSAMAFLAGLALIARVSTGIGLYAALGALLLVIAARGTSPSPESLAARVVSVRVLAPVLVLAAFAAAAGLVNYERWGHALIFADYRYYLYNAPFPDRWPRTVAYGLFNLSRVPFGLVYYFFPVWFLRRGDGHLLFEETQRRLIDSTELPPSSFLLTDTLPLLLLAYAVWALLRARRSGGLDRWYLSAVGAGLAVPCLLMLSAISMCFRYRIEFYPLIEFGAFLGFYLLCARPSAAADSRPARAWAVAPAALGIVASHAIMLLYKVSWLGPSYVYLRSGITAFYIHEFQFHYPRLASWIHL